MLRRQTRVRRQLRSARTSALTQEDRRRELREAQERSAWVRLACVDCGRRFEVTDRAYRRGCGLVECPACGGLHLVLVEDERAS